MIQKPKSVSWKTKEVDDINLSWYEEGIDLIDNKVIYKYYYNKKDNIIYLVDIYDDVVYKFPKTEKAKGYVLAFKLMSKLPF